MYVLYTEMEFMTGDGVGGVGVGRETNLSDSGSCQESRDINRANKRPAPFSSLFLPFHDSTYEGNILIRIVSSFKQMFFLLTRPDNYFWYKSVASTYSRFTTGFLYHTELHLNHYQ